MEDCPYLSQTPRQMLFEQARDFIFNIQERDLPAALAYHTIHHVRDVYACAERIAYEESITADDRKLILTAAAFHDCGFLKTRDGHEHLSCCIAWDVLPVFNYSDAGIDKICGLILATRLPQSPQNHLEQILADADLDYLGRDDFFTIGDKLYQELLKAGSIKNTDDWNRLQVSFMGTHSYFTQTSIAQRTAKKLDNLAQVKAKLKT